MRSPHEMLFILLGLLQLTFAVERFQKIIPPMMPDRLRDEGLLPMSPTASSGTPSKDAILHNPPQMQYRPRYGQNNYKVGEVDSLDLYPNPVAVPPEFQVVNPPDFGPSPYAPQPPAPFPNPAPELPVSRPEPVRPMPGTIPGRPVTEEPEKPDNAYEINYCDKGEFPDDVLATYGLDRVDYFIWNTTCSHIFFQCSIGHTFLLRCTSEDQAFDRATTNCNFKNAVKVCPEYDHVMHCTIRESCSDLEYACCSMPQMCLPLSKRCDGHADCGDGDDENNCPSCKRDEFACVHSGRCIEANQRCDGVPDDCGDGSNMDEIGCSRNETCIGKFMCKDSRVGVACIDWANHCDGNKDCYHGEDEINCRQGGEKYLLCENQKQSVIKLQWCDGTADCADGSDEKYCS